MNIREYVKHRWYMFVIVFFAGIYSYLTAWSSGLISNKDFLYTAVSIIVFFVFFIIIDYIKLQTRLKKMREFLENNCSIDFTSNYPMDIKYAEQYKEIAENFDKYKETTDSEHKNELEFITKWVHDVKVPIAAINLITENMDNDEGQQIQMQLNYIEQNIQKILFHMKSKTFYDDYRIRSVSLKAIINQALKNYAVFFSYKSISLKIDCEDYEVFTDEKWSIYIVSQLISNAVKYTPINGEIIITANFDDDGVSLSIKNTGAGIEERNLENIFRRGYSGYSIRKEKSTGYGLYLSKKLADKMGHRLAAKSKENEYAEFIIYYSFDKNDAYYNNVSLND